jgi:regulation of enolase protein 1 (concanavalin A-like superfamily)
LTDDTVITATFDPVPQPPVISDLVLTPTHNSVAISWTTDKPSTTGYLYGVTPAYELGGNEDGALVTAHSITIPGLAANTLYQVEVYSVDSASNVGSVQTSFTTDPAPVSTIVSDDFSAPALDPNIWTFINPVGDCVLTATGAQAVISVPAGVAHPAWIGGIQAPRIMQAANDADFQVEAKYESLPSAAFQIQGIIVQQDPDDFIRINIQSNGTTASVFVATFHDGAPTIRVFQSISSIVPQWLRVTRANHDWTVEYSFDGAAWSSAGQFSFPIVVSSIGPFVSNEPGTGAAPAFDGVVDYFFNTAAPVAPEDGGRHSMTLNVAGNGAVTRDPNGVLYAPATEVLLTAVPVPGWSFVSWSGDLSGSDNPLNVTVNDDVIATAVFVEDDLTPPIISDFQVNAWTTSATLTFTTDEPAIGRVNYGLTAALEFGTETETAPVTAHSITLIGLDPNTTYFFEAFATDAATNESTTGVSSFATDPIIASTLVSDDFDGTALDPNVWTFIDPVGDAALVVGGSAASIDIPSGAAHDAWVTGVQSPRIVQATNDTDFEAIVKYNSAVTTQYQIQGIVVEQDPNDFIRFDVHYNGTTVVLFAATIAAGQPQIHLSRALGSSTPSYIRVTRSGNQWTLAYSFDGQSWDPQNPFSSDVSVSTVGAFVGNSPKSTGPAPAHVGVIDYFENTASPLPPRFPLTVDTIGQGTVIVDPLYATYAAGSTITLTPVPEPGWMFMRWTGDVFSKATPLVLSITEATTVRARFAPEPRSGTASVFPRP